MNFIESFVEGVAQDFALDKATEKVNSYAEKHVKTKDPYKGPDGKKLKLRANATDIEQKNWKWIQKKAWIDDKCFMGCYPIDCGIGSGPILVAFPCIGPLLINAAIIYSEIDKMLLVRQNHGNNTNFDNYDDDYYNNHHGNVDNSMELHEVTTGNTFFNPFKSNKENTTSNPQNASSKYALPNQQYTKSNPNQKLNRPLDKNIKNNNNNNNSNIPSIPPRDYKTPPKPNKVYQSRENNEYRSVV
ncbi:hypothetical protein C6P40_003568 [Pichia californica]|uniref:Uncharacterized protein n=1 Tax=Pichia californica TaxID=460514 RepID=A0A9P6WIF0_9ASCO|nr:hypothetical protein C6P40_003568 [[Candida] californica]